jgi:uncharacterized RDD family membrane protein YckC
MRDNGPQGHLVAYQLEADGGAQGARLSPQPPEPREEAPSYAGLPARILGWLPDMMVALAFFLLAGGLVAGMEGGRTGAGFNLEGRPAFTALVITFLLWLGYQVLLEARLGATLGKVLAGTQVQRPGHDRVGLWAASIRNLARLVDGIGVYLVGAMVVLVSKRNQRLGDMMAGTVVVPHSYSNAARLTAGGLVLAALAAGGVVGFGSSDPSLAILDGEGQSGTVFAGDEPLIQVIYRFHEPAAPGTVVTFEIYAQAVEGIAPDSLQAQLDIVAADDQATIDWTSPPGGRPEGLYRVKVLVDGEAAASTELRIAEE